MYDGYNDNNNNYSQEFPENTFLWDSINRFRKLTSFYEKSRIACNHFDAREHSLRDLFSTDQENGSE